jgi:hypothetical protein
MSKLLKGAIVALMIAGVTGCVPTSDIQVESAKSEKANLKGYKTYQIINESGVVNDTKGVNTVKVNTEIKQMIISELAKKGKIQDVKDPDFFVAYLAGTDKDAVKVKLDKEGKETLQKAPEAAIVLMFVDAETGSIIWISTAEGEVKGLPADQTKKRINYAIKKMLSEV